jgi:DNA-binding LacI/PurR family transcriptional regulator
MTGFVTLKRVAQEAGVSVYSASRALNGLDGVSDATRARVRAVAKDLGYVPNRTAQMLRGEGTRTVGILTAKSENVYYAKLVAGIEDVVRPAGYHTLTADATDGEAYSQRREAEFIETMLELRVAAVILSYRIRSENLVRLLERQIPVVFVDCTPPDEFSHLPSAMGNGEDISRDVGRHFAEHGYRNWAFLGHTAGWPTREGRQRGLTTAAAEAEATLQIIEGWNSIETAREPWPRSSAPTRDAPWTPSTARTSCSSTGPSARCGRRASGSARTSASSGSTTSTGRPPSTCRSPSSTNRPARSAGTPAPSSLPPAGRRTRPPRPCPSPHWCCANPAVAAPESPTP